MEGPKFGENPVFVQATLICAFLLINDISMKNAIISQLFLINANSFKVGVNPANLARLGKTFTKSRCSNALIHQLCKNVFLQLSNLEN